MMPLLTVIIPTKNRYSTLFSLVDTLLSFDLESFEILVQDNSDNNKEAISFFGTKKSKNLKYYYTSEKLSVIENSDLAVKNSTGEYICFIGDDDGVMPYILDVVKWMNNNSIDVVKGYKPNYSWPGLQISYLEGDTSGVLRYKSWDSNIRTIDCQKELNKALSKGGSDISMLPCLYHGIVSKKALTKVYAKAGSYFPGPSPEMANAIALCFYIDKFKFLNFPIVISGKSSSSAGGKGLLHKHIARIEDVEHLPDKTKNEWSDKIPKYWTGPTIWCESVIKSLNAIGESSRIEGMDFSYLYAELFVFEFKNRKLIFNNFRYNIYSIKFFINICKIFLKRVLIFIANQLKVNIKTVNNVKNIGEAVLVLEKNINKKKMNIES